MSMNGGIDTVTLELLRQGPSGGQLLSASTPYLALCGNGPAEAVFLPLDQRDFQRRLAALRYGVGGAPGLNTEAARAGALEDMARDMTRILDQVRALPGAIERASAEMIHLRLVLSATELAMLPFELANTPRGLPGEGLPLCLVQGTKPVIVTRETRRLRPPPPPWPTNPRILFAHVSHADVPEGLVRAHLLALARALRPWTGWALDGKDADELDRYLTVLPAASVRSIAAACAERAYTHVHVLAHGTDDVEPHTGERRYALALHADGSTTDIVPVSGALLASALRAGGNAVPTVVTLASCDAGNVGSLLVENGSVAHALHESGVSLVIASQLPLSMKGSVVMAETLYHELLSGTDPRLASHVTRQALFREQRSHHDWASLVVYANLPADPRREFDRVRFAHHKIAVDSGMAWLNRHGQPSGRELDAFRAAADALEEQGKAADPVRAQAVDSLLASVAVRWCDPDWPDPREPARAGPPGPCDEPDPERAGDELSRRRAWRCPPRRISSGERRFPSLADSDERTSIERAIDHYEHVFARDPRLLWAGINALALRWYVERLRRSGEAVPFSPKDEKEWCGLVWLADQRLRAGAFARAEEADALAARIELRVLGQLLPAPNSINPSLELDVKTEAEEDIHRLLGLVGPTAWEALALRRQLLRYERWWARPDVSREAWRDEAAGIPPPPEAVRYNDPPTRVRALAHALRAKLDGRGVPIGWDVR
ncbi:CHAT domain-containing protein [Sorangium sp. So ce296]|uniref:CHAT domain-containing protein n=1 Tax=Sorangium sp. So ce296 TaxID=3133296 RepID=UPI003F6453FB